MPHLFVPLFTGCRSCQNLVSKHNSSRADWCASTAWVGCLRDGSSEFLINTHRTTCFTPDRRVSESSGQIVMIEIHIVVSPPFQQNTLIVFRAGRTDCVLVDPGFDAAAIIRQVERLKLTPAAILLTHGHVDHIAGNAAVVARWPGLPILIGKRDAVMLTDPRANLSALSGMAIKSPPATQLLDDGDEIEFAAMKWLVRAIPGHSPGHVVYIAHDETPGIVLGGDVLFAGSIGRTDFPGGSFEQLVSGIKTILFPLPEDTVVYTGHGPKTTIGDERDTNPFIAVQAG